MMTPQEIRQVAVLAMVDPATVRRFLSKRPMRASTEDRVRSAIKLIAADAKKPARSRP